MFSCLLKVVKVKPPVDIVYPLGGFNIIGG
jgi:hypothetical protein